MGDSLLSVKNLHKEFDRNIILKSIDLEVNKGEVIVIIGPSGCGKSTLLRCLNGLEDIQGGEIRLGGKLLRKDAKDISSMRQKIGMVFQSYDLFPHKTILQNITLAPITVKKRKKAEVEEEALKLLDRVGLLSKKDNYPRQLSGGQKQRVAIARAMVTEPKILLADEPTGALDSETGAQVMEMFRQINSEQGTTVIIVTHDPRIGASTKRCIRILDGRIEE